MTATYMDGESGLSEYSHVDADSDIEANDENFFFRHNIVRLLDILSIKEIEESQNLPT